MMASVRLSRAVPLSDRRPVDGIVPIIHRAADPRTRWFWPKSAVHAVGSQPSTGTARRRMMMAIGITAIVMSMMPVLIHARAQERPSTVGANLPRDATDPFASFISEASHWLKVPELWIRAVMRVESNGDANAVSPKGALGLMQIMPETWDELSARYALGDDPHDPRDNILAGAAYLREMYNRFGSPGFLAAYNAGPGRYADHLATGNPLPSETEIYVARLARIVDEGRPPTTSGATRDAQSWTKAPLFVPRAESDSMYGSESEGGRVDRRLTVISTTDRPRADQIFVPASR